MVCRPSGFATFQLEENDLKEPNITVVRPSDPNKCCTQLAAGEVDDVALAVDTADGAMVEIGTMGQIV